MNELSFSGTIVRVKRLSRRAHVDGQSSLVPIRSVLVTFQGQDLPDRVYMYHNSLQVIPYIYNVLYCNSCLCFGHAF